MDRNASIVVGTSVAAVLLVYAAFFGFQSAERHQRRMLAAQPAAAAPAPVERLPGASPPGPTSGAHPAPKDLASDRPALEETALMDTLRELRGSDPTRTLLLARQGNQRFRDSADAAERSWFIVKALSDLGRHDEARLEGRRLVDKYRETRWAEDVYRHLFVNPPTHPFEGGYAEARNFDP